MEENLDLYERVALAFEMRPRQAKKIVNKFFEELGNELAVDKNAVIKISKFGTFSVQLRKPRKGMNNLTREEILIPERRVPVLRFSKTFKDKVDHLG